MKKQQAVDFWLLLPLGGLIVFGLLGVYSATNGTGDTGLFFRQLTWAMIGGVAMLFVYFNDVRFFQGERIRVLYSQHGDACGGAGAGN